MGFDILIQLGAKVEGLVFRDRGSDGSGHPELAFTLNG